MKFKIDGKSHELKKVSELTFKEYNEIIIKREVVDIVDYLSVFADTDRSSILNSEVDIKNASLPALHAALFNADQENILKNPKNTIFFNGEYRTMDSVSISTIGKDYMYDLYLKQYDEGNINIFEMSMFALAIGISESSDPDEISGNYEKLCDSIWTDVLPQGFFLIKNSKRKLLERARLYLSCISESKKTHFRTQFYLKKLIKQEKS